MFIYWREIEEEHVAQNKVVDVLYVYSMMGCDVSTSVYARCRASQQQVVC